MLWVATFSSHTNGQKLIKSLENKNHVRKISLNPGRMGLLKPMKQEQGWGPRKAEKACDIHMP